MNSSRKSSTQRCTTQKRQKSAIAKSVRGCTSEPDRVEEGDRKSAVEEEVREVAVVLDVQFRPEAAEHDRAPEHQPHDQQYLPEPSKIQVLPALRAEERPHDCL